MAEQQRNTFGILGDNNMHGPVIDTKGRDSRREIDRFDSLMQFYADRIVVPETWWTKH